MEVLWVYQPRALDSQVPYVWKGQNQTKTVGKSVMDLVTSDFNLTRRNCKRVVLLETPSVIFSVDWSGLRHFTSPDLSPTLSYIVSYSNIQTLVLTQQRHMQSLPHTIQVLRAPKASVEILYVYPHLRSLVCDEIVFSQKVPVLYELKLVNESGTLSSFTQFDMCPQLRKFKGRFINFFQPYHHLRELSLQTVSLNQVHLFPKRHRLILRDLGVRSKILKFFDALPGGIHYQIKLQNYFYPLHWMTRDNIAQLRASVKVQQSEVQAVMYGTGCSEAQAVEALIDTSSHVVRAIWQLTI